MRIKKENLYAAAIAINPNSYFSIEQEGFDFLSVPYSNAETRMIKKDLFEKSTKEVQTIIRFLLTDPQEILGGRLKRRDIKEFKVSKKKILSYLKLKANVSYRKQIQIMNEVRSLLLEMLSIKNNF